MLTKREETVLSSIIKQYISQATPVSSTAVIEECGIDVCSATVRNDVVRLEQEGYIIRPHHSAGSIPSDKGYRYYVESLENIELPINERFMISHLFHQVEMEMEEWLNLTASLLAKRVHNLAVIWAPRSPASRFHHLELVAIQDTLALVVLVLRGARLKQQLINFSRPVSQQELAEMSARLNNAYSGLSRGGIKNKKLKLDTEEQLVKDSLIKMMKAEDDKEYDRSYLDGLQFMLEQPEFSKGQQAHNLMEMVEQRKLSRIIDPEELGGKGVQVIIGKENKEEAFKGYSVVVSHYGLPNEAIGTLGIIGPTRMRYELAISFIGYLSLVMSRLIAELYGGKNPWERRGI